MMELYFKLAVMLVLWAVGCHGQQVPDLTVERLHSRVQGLEKTVEQLLIKLVEMQNSQTDTMGLRDRIAHVSDLDSLFISGYKSRFDKSPSYLNCVCRNTSSKFANINVSTKASAPAAQKRGFMYPGLSAYSRDVSTQLGLTSAGEVGFQVSLSEDVQLGYGMRIPFNIVEENFGDAYRMGAAEFECPVSGTYLFSLNIVCRMGSYLEITVEINNGIELPRYILNTVCDHRKRNIPGGGSLYCGETHNGGTAIVSLSKDEIVTVKKVWPIDDVSIIAGEGLSTFSGYLLNAKG